MRRAIATLLMVAVLTFGGTALAKNDNNGGGGGVPEPAISLSLADCCKIAKAGYLASVQQPPTLTAIANAAAAVRATMATGVPDRLLQRFWPVK